MVKPNMVQKLIRRRSTRQLLEKTRSVRNVTHIQDWLLTSKHSCESSARDEDQSTDSGRLRMRIASSQLHDFTVQPVMGPHQHPATDRSGEPTARQITSFCPLNKQWNSKAYFIRYKEIFVKFPKCVGKFIVQCPFNISTMR